MRVGKFTEENWLFLLAEFAKVFGQEAADKLKGIDVAKFMASALYVAESQDPDRFALGNLLVFWADKLCGVWDYRVSDDDHLFRRAEGFNWGSESNHELIEFAIRAMSITAIKNYVVTAAADKAAGICNPINTGAINPVKELAKLERENERFYPIWQKAAPTVVSQPTDW
jgi:hypothetical protein